jgi:hypothetical protein
MRALVDSIAVGFRNDVEPLWFGCLFSQTLQAASALGLSPYDCETSVVPLSLDRSLLLIGRVEP